MTSTKASCSTSQFTFQLSNCKNDESSKDDEEHVNECINSENGMPDRSVKTHTTHLYLKQPPMVPPHKLLTEQQFNRVKLKIPLNQEVEQCNGHEKSSLTAKELDKDSQKTGCNSLSTKICQNDTIDDKDLEDWEGSKFNAKYDRCRKPILVKMDELRNKVEIRSVEIQTRTLTPMSSLSHKDRCPKESLFSSSLIEENWTDIGNIRIKPFKSPSLDFLSSSPIKEKQVHFNLEKNQHHLYRSHSSDPEIATKHHSHKKGIRFPKSSPLKRNSSPANQTVSIPFKSNFAKYDFGNNVLTDVKGKMMHLSVSRPRMDLESGYLSGKSFLSK